MNTFVQSEVTTEGLTQLEIARLAGVSQPAISTWLRRAGIKSGDVSMLHNVMALCIAELARHGMSGWQAASLVGGCRSEIHWLLHDPSRECWLVVLEHEGEVVSFRAAHHREQLGRIFVAKPVARLVTLHTVVTQARQHLEQLQQEGGNA